VTKRMNEEKIEEIGWDEETFVCKRCGRLFPSTAEWAYGLCEDCYYKDKNEVEEMMKELCPDAADYDI